MTKTSASNGPYPGFAPSYKNVRKIGGMYRECFVVELRYLEEIPKAQRTAMKERLELEISKIVTADVENFVVASSDNFDRVLLDGLRL